MRNLVQALNPDRKYLFPAFGFIVSLSACALKPYAPQDARLVPAERIYSERWNTARPGTGRLTISAEPETTFSLICYDRLSVDGEVIARLQEKERLDLYLEPGSHVVGVRPEGPCAGWGADLEVRISAGDWAWYRVDTGLEGMRHFLSVPVE
jgi:hypothetical protein